MHVNAKQRMNIMWFRKHKIKPKYVSIQLEMLSST